MRWNLVQEGFENSIFNEKIEVTKAKVREIFDKFKQDLHKLIAEDEAKN